MIKNFVIVTTGSGRAYARKISTSLSWYQANRFPTDEFKVFIWSVNQFFDGIQQNHLEQQNTVIYARAAYPTVNGWMGDLKELEEYNFRVINKVSTLRLTSDKGRCAETLINGGVIHPRSKIVTTALEVVQFLGGYSYTKPFVLKPLTSMEQGARVRKFLSLSDISPHEGYNTIISGMGGKAVIQELVDYVALYRVIVINGKALPYSFVDRPEWHPEEWKVSVCLNRTTMQLAELPEPLKNIAEQAQRLVNGEINFIDVFETREGIYTMSEINTACNLSIHEHLAQLGGESKWNIHFWIAKYLVETAYGLH